MPRLAKANIKKVSVRCAVCNADDYDIVAKVREFEYDNTTTDDFQFVVCRRCHLFYLNPRPDVSELGTIYPPEYHVYIPPASTASSFLKKIRAFPDFIRMQIEKQRVQKGPLSLVSGIPNAKILDIGCADGRQLLMMKHINPNLELYGVELDDKSAHAARQEGLDVRSGTLEHSNLPNEYFHLAYCANIIEHVDNPGGFLKKIHSLLLPRGYVVLLTPRVGGLDYLLFRKRYWGAYHVPRHWNLWNDENFTRFAHDCGFEVVKISSVLVPTHWIWSLHHWCSEHRFPSWFVDGITMHNFFWLGLFTCLEIILSKVYQTSEMHIVLQKPLHPGSKH